MFDIGSEPERPATEPSRFSSFTDCLARLHARMESGDSALDSVSGASLCSLALDLEALRKGLDSLSIAVLAELDVRGTTDTEHGMRTGSWLASNGRLPGGGSRAKVKTANKIRSHFPAIAGALDVGRIGFDHAKVLCDAANPRIIEEFKAYIDPLIDLVELMPFDRWKREVQAVADLLDQDGGHQPGDDITDNVLTLSPGLGGSVSIQGQLCGENALVLSDAVSARADQIFHRMTRDAELAGGICGDLRIPDRRTLMALALTELIREALSKQATARSAHTVAPRSDVSLIINAEDAQFVTNTDGVPIGDTTKFTLLCDPVLRPVVMDVNGIVIDLGRDHRLVNDALRRALHHRDGGCVWPGCENPPSWCDAHHVQLWIHGGTTDRPNLGLLCRYHHGVVHRKGWSMHATEDQWFWWQSPSGHTFWSQRHGKQRQGPTPDHPTEPDGDSRGDPGGGHDLWASPQDST